MRNYLNLISTVKQTGKLSEDRTEIGTIRRFAINRDLRFDLSKTFPAPSTKKLAEKAVFGELLWFINGGTSIGELKQYTFGDSKSENKTIWCANYAKQGKELGYTDGYCGPVYGYNWRNFGAISGIREGVDQLQNLINSIKNNPEGRRHVVYTVDPATVNQAILPPCHDFFQCFVEDGKLSLDFHMRY